jgi:hypothetical protein
LSLLHESLAGAARGSRDRIVALIGRLANLPNTGDLGSSKVRPPEVVTVYRTSKIEKYRSRP